MTRRVCVLCGADVEVSVSLVEWRDPLGPRRFDAVLRCRDRRACQERVALLGEAWPLVEAKR